MKNLLIYISLVFIFGSCFSKQPTQNTANTEQSQETQPSNFTTSAALQAKKCVLDNGDSLCIFLELDIPRLDKTKDLSQTVAGEITINYGLLTDYTSREFLVTSKINLLRKNVFKLEDKYYASFNVIKRPTISEVMILEVIDGKTNQKDQLDFLISYTSTKLREKYVLAEKQGKAPLFSNYVLSDDTIQVIDIDHKKTELIVRYYSQEFSPALPPMSTKPTVNIPKILRSDSTFKIIANTPVHFNKKGLYLIQKDTTEYYGLSLFVSDLKYPKLSRLTDVIEPLVYITTPDELTQLGKHKEFIDTKKELDKMWLRWVSGNVNVAKQVIRVYFQRIKLANQYFTTHKEGWKTDMGMIFIIYGRPSRVIHNNDKELWVYTQSTSFSEMNFTFLRKPNQFSDNDFILVRYPDYETVWYPMIEQWREGKIQ
jgi:GWxTD domain-containing protein